MSGADLEYRAQLARAGITGSTAGLDGARLEQLADEHPGGGVDAEDLIPILTDPTAPDDERFPTFADTASLALAGGPEDPVSLGTTNVGSLDAAARADHVHPADGMFWVWGSGYDGNLNFDGTTTVVLQNYTGVGLVEGVSFVPVAGKYTIDRPIAANNIVLGNNVELAMNTGAFVRVKGLLSCPTGSAKITVDGSAGLANGTGGPAYNNQGVGNVTSVGGAGNTGAGSGGSVPSYPSDQWGAGSSGAGGAGASGAGGAGAGSGMINFPGIGGIGRDPLSTLFGIYRGVAGPLDSFAGGTSGGGGGGDGTNKGGGGGSGGGLLIVNAKRISGNILFRAKGGNGGSPTVGNCGGGGGGSGGFVFVNTVSATGYTGTVSQAVSTPGGTGGTKNGTGVNGNSGGVGIAVMTVW